MSDVLPTIPTLQDITQPPSLGRPTTFDQEAEAYLYSQYGLMQDLNTVIGVLNPVAQAVLQYRLTAEQAANQTARDLQAIQQIAIQAGQDADTAVQAATTASQHLTATAEERQTAEQAAQLATAKAQEAAQWAIEAGPTHLSQTRTADNLTIHSSTGNDVELPAATPTEAGLMSAGDKAILAAGTGGFVKKTVFTSSGTWTPDPSTKFAIVEAIGGGGGGGAFSTYSSGTCNYISGGAGGGYVQKTVSSPFNASYQVVVGAGGSGGIAQNTSVRSFMADGADGGDSYVGSLCFAPGGSGGCAAEGYYSYHMPIQRQKINNGVTTTWRSAYLKGNEDTNSNIYRWTYGAAPSGHGGTSTRYDHIYHAGMQERQLAGIGGYGYITAGGGGGVPLPRGSTTNAGYVDGGESAVAGGGGRGRGIAGVTTVYGGSGGYPGGGGGAAATFEGVGCNSYGGNGRRGEVRIWEFK